MKKFILLSIFLLGLSCNSQNSDIKKKTIKHSENIQENSFLEEIIDINNNYTESNYNENSFNSDMLFWSIKNTFKTKVFDEIEVINCINFDLKNNSFVLYEWIFKTEYLSKEGISILEKIKNKRLLNYPVPNNWKYFRYKKRIYFLYSFTEDSKNEDFQKLFNKIAEFNRFREE